MGLLAKAKAREVATEKDAPQPTVWKLGAEHPLNATIVDLVRLEGEQKTIERKTKDAKEALKLYADQQYIDACARTGSPPTSPIFIQTSDGLAVNYVVQDCSQSTALTPAQVTGLKKLLGDAAAPLFSERTCFELNQEILKLPGVQPLVERALQLAIDKLRESKALTQEQADTLIIATTTCSFANKILDRLTAICGRSRVRLTSFLALAGAATKRYVKL